ncbi:MAG: M4 family metallopeptidase, partial [Acidobacteriota bacterium]|nr:M4 family metallopeptidase [Acidobacteriota bacterium]
MATKGRLALSFLTSALASGALLAAVPQTVAAQRASSQLMAQREQMGLDADHSFALRTVQKDPDLNATHTRFDKLYNGVKVWGGDLIAHSGADGELLGITTNHKEKIRINVNPTLGAAEALAVAHQALNPMGPYVSEPTAELVIYPMTVNMRRAGRSRVVDQDLNAEDVVRTVVRNALAYHVHVALENGTDETIHRDYMIDAHTGRILKQWDDLHTAAATGTGNSQYSGTVSLDTNSTASGFELRDMTRGTGGTFGNNVVTDMAHSTTGNGTIFTNATNTWGDGANYNGGSTTNANGQTAAVDAAYGIKWTWDYYKNVLGRNGIDNTGKASYLRVHYSSAYDNAFWSDACFCMTFGDGSSFKSLESIDVAGHEMSHGVCATTANLTYSGESGGLNEANSDIHGTMVEFYAHGGGTTTVPATGGNWTIGEQLSATPLRYMYKPSLDGTSPDAWSSTIGSLDVHYSSGPSNRAFYFLSQGATTTGNTSTTYLPSGMTGVGNDHAARIAYRALSVYMTASTNYAAARTAYISAAKDLYGAGSAEEQAVWNAFHGINVGAAWGGTPPPPPPPGSTFVEVEANNSIAAANTVARTYTAIQGNLSATGDTDFFALTLNPGENLAIAMTGPAGVDWDLKLLNSAGTQLAISQGSTATENISYTNSGTTAVTVYPNVYIYSGTSATPYNLALTYTGGTPPPPSDTTPPTASASESGTSGTITLSATATDNVGVTKVEFYVDGVLKGTDTASPYTMTLDSTTLTNATHSLVAKAYDAAGNVGTSTAVSFTINNTTPPPPPPGGTQLILNGGFETATSPWTGTTGDIGAWTGEPAHAGTRDCWMLGNGATATENIAQTISIPSAATSANLTFYLHIDTAETTTTTAYDTLKVQVRNTAGTVLGTLAT